MEIEEELNVHKKGLKMQNEELLNTQLQLLKSVEDYIELFDNLPVSYFIMDTNGIIMNVNTKGSKLIGIDKKQLIGKPLSLFINGESNQDDYCRHRKLALDTDDLMQIESEIKKKDGSIFPVLIESVSLRDQHGDFKHLLAIINDISKQKEYERQIELALAKEKELSEMKSRFIATTSHEFRTPLSTILSSVSLIESYHKTEDGAKRKRHINKIVSAVNGLKEILTEFFSFDQIEKNLITNNPETFNIVRLTEETISMIDAKNHTMVYKHSGEFQDAYLDIKLLKICLINLLSNAIKYSPNTGTIEITTKKSTRGDIEISVKDYGIGIPDNEKEHIFGPFFKAKNADAIEGTGIGLNIIQKLITLMGGAISFESKINEGTVFVLKFPVKNKKKSKKEEGLK